MYLIREKARGVIVNENPAPLGEELTAKDLKPDFDAQTMEFLRYGGSELPEHYNVDKTGLILEKTVVELAAEGLISFGPELAQYLEAEEPTGEALPPEVADAASVRLIELALQLKLIKSVEDCQCAFEMLDEEFEMELRRKYRPGYENKIMKDCIEWLMAGKPKGDKRHAKYETMQASLAAIKEKYRPLRTELKEIIKALQGKSDRDQGKIPVVTDGTKRAVKARPNIKKSNRKA